MGEDVRVRWGWLKFMYIYTLVGAGGFGITLIVVPDTVLTAFGWPDQDVVVLGVMASVYTGFGITSILGLRSPLKFSPVLLLQLAYKLIWMVFVAAPLAVYGQLAAHGLVLVAIFASYIIGDLIAIPFGYLFGKESRGQAESTSGHA